MSLALNLLGTSVFGRSPQPMASDPVSVYMLAEVWPDPAAITSFLEMEEHYRAAYSVRLARLEELQQAESTIRATMVSDDFDAMYMRMDRVCRDQGAVVDNAATMAKWAGMFADECCAAQLSLINAIEPYREKAEQHLAVNEQLEARIQLELGRNAARAKQAEYLETIESWAARAQGEIQTVKPWTPSSPAPSVADGNEDSIKALDFAPPKSSGRLNDGTTDAPPTDTQQVDAAGDPDEKSQDKQNRPGRKEAESTDVPGADVPESGLKGSGAMNPISTDPAPTTSSARAPITASPGAGSMVGGGLPSSGGGMPSSGGLQGSGLGGLKPPSADGLGSQAGLSSAGSGLGGPAAGAGSAASAARGGAGLGSGGGAAGGGDGAARVGGVSSPLSAVPPVSAAPQVAVRPEAAAAGGGGGFVPPPGAVAPVQHGSAAGAGAVGGMPGGAVMGAAPSPPPSPAAAAPVGAAPAASPGLSQGSLGPAAGGGAAAAAGGGAAAAGLGMTPTAFSEETPTEVDRHGQLAVDAVRMLAPAMAIIPGMLVAAAVLVEPGGAPHVVITTNDGAGFLPPGCFLPPTMIHAFADLDSAEFDGKWFGWADPARVLLDYAAYRAQRVKTDVRLLGLASSGRISAEVKSVFKQAIPLVTPESSAKPLEENQGRNAHRLKVLAPDFYNALMKAPKDIRYQAAVRAATAAMATPAAAPLRAVGGPWHTMNVVGRGLTEPEWNDFRQRYDTDVRTCGALRPGFLTDAAAGTDTGYAQRFALVRAMEVLMCWRAPEVSAADVVYSAHQTGADVNGILN